jgi:hypothetical protein
VQTVPTWLDDIVFGTIKRGFGGRVRFVVSGGAPISPAVQEYLTIVFCVPVLQVGPQIPVLGTVVPLWHGTLGWRDSTATILSVYPGVPLPFLWADVEAEAHDTMNRILLLVWTIWHLRR